MFKLSTDEEILLKQAVSKEAVYQTIVNMTQRAFDGYTADRENNQFYQEYLANVQELTQESDIAQYKDALNELQKTVESIAINPHRKSSPEGVKPTPKPIRRLLFSIAFSISFFKKFFTMLRTNGNA